LKVIWHFYANRVNMGDWASALGVRQFLSESIQDELTFVDHFLSQEITDKEMSEINEKADLIVVGGGGLFFRKDFPLGWYWNITPQQLAAIRCPIVVYAVGLNDVAYTNCENWLLNQHSIDGIVQVVNRAALVGVRDKWTLDWLQKQTPKQVFLVPCPAMFYRGNHQEEHVQDDLIGINIVPLSRIRNKRAFLSFMDKLLTWICGEGFRVVYLCHGSRPHDGIQEISRYHSGSVITPNDPAELLKAYNSVRLVIGMRAHAIIFAFNRNRPVFTISYARKCEAFLNMLGMECYSAKWKPFPLFGINPYVMKKMKFKIYDLLQQTVEVRDSWQHYQAIYKQYNQEFAKRVAKLL